MQTSLNVKLNLPQEGETTIKGYGLALARTVRFPPSIMPRAEVLYNVLIRNEPSKLPSNPDQSNIATLVRQRSSNPIYRTFRSTNHTLSEVQPNQSDICVNKRELYDLYANVMEVIRCSETVELFQDSINTLMMQFMEQCDMDLKSALNIQPVEIILGPYFVRQEEAVQVGLHAERLPTPTIERNSVERDATRPSQSDAQVVRHHSLTVKETLRSSITDSVFDFNQTDISFAVPDIFAHHSSSFEHSALNKEATKPSRTDAIFDLHLTDFPETYRSEIDSDFQQSKPTDPGINTSRTDRSVTFSENIQFRDIETYPSEVPLRSSNRTNNWSDHSLISNMNYKKRHPGSSLKILDNNRSRMMEDIRKRNMMKDQLSQISSPPRKIPSDTETNMSRPSFKSFIRGFTRKPPAQLAPEPISFYLSQLPNVSHLPQLQTNRTSFFNTQDGRKSRSVVTPSKTVNYFADMPDTFWKSMDEFENGTQFQELRDFVNEGIPPAWPRTNSNFNDLFGQSVQGDAYQEESLLISSNIHRNSPRPNLESFLDGSKRSLPFDHQESSSFREVCGTPNVFNDLENFVNRSSSDQASLPKRSRMDHQFPVEHIATQIPETLNTQNAMNFLADFESSFSENITMDPAFDIPVYHSIFDLTPAEENDDQSDNRMEQNDVDFCRRTQSRDTASSFNDMDPTQHVDAIISQLSSQHHVEDLSFSTAPRATITQSTETNEAPKEAQSTSFAFKVPAPPDLTQLNYERPTICASPTQSENLHRIEEYVNTQYDRAIVHPMPSSSTSSNTNALAPPPEQYPEIHSTSSQSPVRSSSSIISSAAFRTPLDHRIRTPSNQTTLGGVADSLRRYINANRDSDEEDLFADCVSPTQGFPVNQEVIRDWNRVNDENEEVQMVEIIIPAPAEFQ